MDDMSAQTDKTDSVTDDSNNVGKIDDEAKKTSIMRILVATDNHLGYLEKDPIRGDDSFNSFEEILQYAHQLDVDMVLLGGDLFHDNKPSRSCLYRTMELFRKYCLGESRVKIKFLSDQSVNFANQFHTVNYEDPNFNISLPVFSIHGNHDDPTGEGGLAALDLLSVSNLVNYFGKSDDIDDISIYPLLIGKGDTKIAIYGLGNIRDERLYRTFSKQKVKFMKPLEHSDDWFNILVLHQNRVAHNPKNYVHEKMIDTNMDFVIWGHEHECLINPQASSVGEFHVTQPGSSVATALSEGESRDKFVGLLEVCKNSFRFKPFPLNTIRPFVLDSIVLSDSGIHPTEQGEVLAHLESKVESMVAEAKEKVKGKPNENMLPLIRLKVDYTGYSSVNPQKFGQRFAGRVANQNDILLFYRKKSLINAGAAAKDSNIFENEKTTTQEKIKVGDFISEFLGNTPSDRLQILSESELHAALHNFVEKDESEALLDMVNLSLTATHKYLSSQLTVKDAHEDFVLKFVDEHFPIQNSNQLLKGQQTITGMLVSKPNEDDDDIDIDRLEDSHGHEHGHGDDSPIIHSDNEDTFNDGAIFSNSSGTRTTTTTTTTTSPKNTVQKRKTPSKSDSIAPSQPTTPSYKRRISSQSITSTPISPSSQVIPVDSSDEDVVQDSDSDYEPSTPKPSKSKKKAPAKPTAKRSKSQKK